MVFTVSVIAHILAYHSVTIKCQSICTCTCTCMYSSQLFVKAELHVKDAQFQDGQSVVITINLFYVIHNVHIIEWIDHSNNIVCVFTCTYMCM